MGIVIDHEARKREIIEKSIRLFAEQGYNGVTYQKIADSCGIARTTLYQYFHNKLSIFNHAIWEVTSELIRKYEDVLHVRTSVADRLESLLTAVLKLLFTEKALLIVIVDFLLTLGRGKRSVAREIEKHTIGLKRILQRLLLEGMRKGEFRPLHVSLTVEQLYSLLESAFLRLTVSQNADLDKSLSVIRLAIRELKQEDSP